MAEEYSSHSSIDGANELADKIVEVFNLADGKDLLIGLMSGYEIQKKEQSLIVYDGGKTAYLIKRFVLAKRVKGCTENTCRLYTHNLNRFYTLVGKDPSQCEHTDVQAYIAKLIIEKKSKNYQSNILRTLSSFYKWLTKEGLVEKNIMDMVDSIKVKTPHKKSFSDMDVEKIRLACRTTRESAMVEVMLSTGCRVFECTELTIEQCKGDEIQIVGKGEKPRTVFLNAKAQIAIDVYLKERKDDNPYLFPASINVGISAAKKKPPRGGAEWYLRPEQVSKDDHIDKSSFGYIIRKIGKRAGVENCHPHRFRRTCATFALRRGMDVTLVQMMLGHESLETTQRYLDIADEDLKTAHKRYVV